ncbi:hypothetical protein GH714_002356 [Hevea brasiliensis]|uniref:Uncharacterized protein n=1 Tax=Hevea brasiliensis TaxID=3981 RepID=A0A6A6MBU1_HEVBR|nr:hypothetical protein GH714_002356 [Hevea brasiliensis]
MEDSKNLLRNKGFEVREHVQLQSITCPDSIATTLEKILGIARITHLDEVELYFCEVDECSSVEYCSPRNEVEALNSILSLVNSLLSRKTRTEMNVLQAFQDAIVNRLEKFVDKNREESRIDKSYSCDKEKRIAEWGEINGIKSRLEIVYVEGAGRGAIATKDLKVGDIALEIPVSIIISEDIVHQSDMVCFLIWLSFGVAAIVALDGTLLLEEIMQAKECIVLVDTRATDNFVAGKMASRFKLNIHEDTGKIKFVNSKALNTISIARGASCQMRR